MSGGSQRRSLACALLRQETIPWAIIGALFDIAIIATITITINAINDGPTINDGSFSTDEDTSITYDLSNLGASDIDGDTLTYTISQNPTKGTASIDSQISMGGTEKKVLTFK